MGRDEVETPISYDWAVMKETFWRRRELLRAGVSGTVEVNSGRPSSFGDVHNPSPVFTGELTVEVDG